VQGIYEIYQDVINSGQETLAQYSWYKTLKLMIMNAAKNDDAEFKKMLNNPIKTSQRLMNDNSSHALELVANSTKQQ